MHSTSSTAPTEISGANGGLPYCPNMAGLKPDGIDYLFAYTSQPSDSFPGLMALMAGGSPRAWVRFTMMRMTVYSIHPQ
jgi:hypothetical protein